MTIHTINRFFPDKKFKDIPGNDRELVRSNYEKCFEDGSFCPGGFPMRYCARIFYKRRPSLRDLAQTGNIFMNLVLFNATAGYP